MPEQRKGLTPAPRDASSPAQPCTHPPQLVVHLQVPGRKSELLACQGCGLVKHAASPWREPDKQESDAVIARLYHVPAVVQQTAGGVTTLELTLDAPSPASARCTGDLNEGPCTEPGCPVHGVLACLGYDARPAAPQAPLESTANRYAVGVSGRGLTRIVAPPRHEMDRQAALNLVAWLSVLADLSDAEILAARRQVEAT
jgi:hypothetical protein